MSGKYSTTAGNLLRGDLDSRDEMRAAAHLLALLAPCDSGNGAAYVLYFEKDDETGKLVNLGVYDYDDFVDLQEVDDEDED
jgi:hypothetical protein